MFDELDTQSVKTRETALFASFSDRLGQILPLCPGLAKHLDGFSTDAIVNRKALQTLPVLRKTVLMQSQQENPPFGGFVNESALDSCRVFMSPGPVWEPQLAGSDPWQAARSLAAAGIKRGQRVHNAFSYHLTPGGFILDEGARALGCIVFPAGVGGTDTQVEAIQHLQSEVYVGTPDFLQVLLNRAMELESPITSIKRAMVSGGALFPAMRVKYEEQGVHVQQSYATADLGVIAYETATDGMVHPGMVVNEGLIVEILVPGTDKPVKPGDVGEIVVTRLHKGYPLIRFGTGDLSAEILEPSPCGRTQMRLAGWMGRADQRVKVRGMFVDPVQLQSLPKAVQELDGWRLLVQRDSDKDVMQLHVTVKADMASSERIRAAVEARLVAALKTATNLSGTVKIVDSLPNDGIVVEDQRDYETK
ncbi:MAG: phenylacetate-CoA ligase [Granulosicoccus sp.]|jgi:phenylacetate-CoA ligase